MAVLQMNQYPMREQIPEIMEERQEILHIREQRAATQPGRIPAEEKAQKGGERAESGNDVAAISMDPEDSVSGPANASSDTGADDTGKMVRGKGTTKNGSAPVAVFVIVVVAAAVVGITAGVKISKKRK